MEMVIGEKYRFKNQPETLEYFGYNLSGNGYWHQFKNIDMDGIWCELQDADLEMIELVNTTKKGSAVIYDSEIQKIPLWGQEHSKLITLMMLKQKGAPVEGTFCLGFNSNYTIESRYDIYEMCTCFKWQLKEGKKDVE